MDGSGRKEIVNTNLGLPRAITVDNPEGLGGRIYWTDSFLKLIESTTLEGKDRQNLLGESLFHYVTVLLSSVCVFYFPEAECGGAGGGGGY